jgi:hypothetical protein
MGSYDGVRSRLLQRRYRALRDLGVSPVEAGKASKGHRVFAAALEKAGGDPFSCPELSERFPRWRGPKKRPRTLVALPPHASPTDTGKREASRR